MMARRHPIWRVARCPLGVTAVLLAAFGVLVLINYARVLYGPDRALTVAQAWSGAVDLDSLAVQGARETARAATQAPPPILDILRTQWVHEVNHLYPALIVGSRALPSGDLLLVFNPMAYDIFDPDARFLLVRQLADSWRAVLATGGAPWPSGYQPGVVVLRRDTTAGSSPRVFVTADVRDNHAYLYQ